MKTIFFDAFSYTTKHYLTHPWVFFHDLRRAIRYAWQRIHRGWDETAIWSIDYWLCEIMPDMLQQLKETKHGVPIACFDDPYDPMGDYSEEEHQKASARFDSYLDEMAEGFRAALRIQNHTQPVVEELYDIFHERYPGESVFIFDREREEDETFLKSITHPGLEEIEKELNYDVVRKQQETEDWKKFHRGMILFHQWFFSLWD